MSRDSGVVQGMLPSTYGRSIRYVEDRNERDVISFAAPPRQQTEAGLTDNSPQCGSSWATSCMGCWKAKQWYGVGSDNGSGG